MGFKMENRRMKILNLYAGIGGNRRLWGDDYDITAVELNPKIADIYKDFFPNDCVIVDDAHEFLRKNFREFDFIWTSPPCPTHSILQMTRINDKNIKYPDMVLYQEILLLSSFFKGKWVVENVAPYYQPLISPTFIMGRHYYWSSDLVFAKQCDKGLFNKINNNVSEMEKEYGFDLSKYKRKVEIRKCLRNCVHPNEGKYIFDSIFKNKDQTSQQTTIFDFL